jgi:hypothetical protein
LEQVKCRVEIENNISELFGTPMELRWGDTLSCILLNRALEKVVRDSEIETK